MVFLQIKILLRNVLRQMESIDKENKSIFDLNTDLNHLKITTHNVK